MSEPYTVAMISAVLKGMPADRLAAVQPRNFQMWPTRRIVPAAIIRELIDHERAVRKSSNAK